MWIYRVTSTSGTNENTSFCYDNMLDMGVSDRDFSMSSTD